MEQRQPTFSTLSALVAWYILVDRLLTSTAIFSSNLRPRRKARRCNKACTAGMEENLQMVQALYVLARSYREVPTAGLRKYLGPVLDRQMSEILQFCENIHLPQPNFRGRCPPHRTKLRTLSPICVQTCSRCAMLDPSLGPSWSQLSTQYPIASFPSHTFSVNFRIFLQLKLPPQWNWLCNARNL